MGSGGDTTVIDTRIGAVDALRSTIANLKGASDALSARAALEGDDLAAMLSESLDAQAGRLEEVGRWLEEHTTR